MNTTDPRVRPAAAGALPRAPVAGAATTGRQRRTGATQMPDGLPSTEIDLSRPSAARVYDYGVARYDQPAG
ncbi:hypothetical protein [Micromonospora sp. RTGN7]|uniref:hypothetical protein n=1 Tax=Micromonospora sp. RTGN7 TaxID=3016526 RepID=UPI0029FF208B|nr:hypothetical protein [Micromonospora sp. RTGN7]